MDFTNSEVFIKICDEKGPNNIETAAAVVGAGNSIQIRKPADLYGSNIRQDFDDMYADSMQPTFMGSTAAAASRHSRVLDYDTYYSQAAGYDYEYDC